MSPVAAARHDRRARLSRSLLWLGERIAYLGLWLAAAALLAIVALNAVNIVLRYFFFAAFSWAEEAMLYLMIFGVYAGAVSVAWQQAHIRIDAFLELSRRRAGAGLSTSSARSLLGGDSRARRSRRAAAW